MHHIHTKELMAEVTSIFLDPSILGNKAVEHFIQSIVGDEFVLGQRLSC